MKNYREALSERRMAELRSVLKPREAVAPAPIKTDAELIEAAQSWDIEVSSELISNIAEKSAQKAGEA